MWVDSVRELHNLGKNLSFVRLLNLEGIPDTLPETRISTDGRYIEYPTFANSTDIINYAWQVK